LKLGYIQEVDKTIQAW